MLRIPPLLVFLMLSLSGMAVNIDSLRQAMRGLSDSARLQQLDLLCQSMPNTGDVVEAANVMLDFATTKHDTFHMAMAHHHLGGAYEGQGKMTKSIESHRTAIRYFHAIDRLDKVARQCVNLGNRYANIGMYDSAMAIYMRGQHLAIRAADSNALVGAIVNISTIHHDQGDREQELANLMEALSIVQTLKDTSRIGAIYLNLAVYYLDGKDHRRAIDMVRASQRVSKSAKDHASQATAFNIYANVYYDDGKYDSTLMMLDSAIAIYRKIGIQNRVAMVLMNQGSVYGKLEKNEKCREKTLEARRIFESINDPLYAAHCDIQLAHLAKQNKNFGEAIKLVKNAIATAKKIGVGNEVMKWTGELATVYKDAGQYLQAYDALELHLHLKDSLHTLQREENLAEMETRFQTQKKQLEIENLMTEKELGEAKLERERTQRQILTGGLILALVLILLVAYALIQKRRDNRKISQQKREVEAQNETIAYQKLVVEEKNREITDSITYAKRIQSAILPDKEHWGSILLESFVLFLPKDIVAGDFYWIEPVNTPEGPKVLFAAADCTGHGVPGAMVSVVCHNALNRAVREYGLHRPGEILDKVRSLVIETFEVKGRSGDDAIKDGMDIALCSLDMQNRTVEFAGANNPLWVVSEHPILLNTKSDVDGTSLYELKGDKQPIGAYDDLMPFHNTLVKLHEGDTIYIFSDGYADQFGGERGKKFKYSALRDLLLSSAKAPLKEQKRILREQFEEWRGEMDQVDDVCIIGVKV